MEATCDRMYSYAMRVGRLLASNAKGKAAVEVARRVDVAAYISRMQSGILQSYDAVRRVPWGSWATEKSLIFSSSCAHNAPCNRVHTYVMGGVSQVERYFYFSNATVTSAASRSLDVVSPFVSFFHHIPRFGFANRLKTHPSYIDGVAAAVVPFLILAVCLLSGNDTYLNRKEEEDKPKAGACTTLGVSMFFIAALSALALALASNWHLWAGTKTTLLVAHGSASQLRTDAHGVFAVAEKFLVRLDEKLAHNPLLKTGLSFSNVNLNPKHDLKVLRETKATFDEVADQVDLLQQETRGYSAWIFTAVVVVVVLLGLSFYVLFTQNTGSFRSPPLVAALAWLLVAVTTAAALIAADTCSTVSEFRQILLLQSGALPKKAGETLSPGKNLIIQAGIQCPHKLVKTSSSLTTIVKNLGYLLDNRLTDVLLKYAYPSSRKSDRKILRKWLAMHLQSAVSCDMLIEHVTNINNAFCAREGPMLGLFSAWIALISLAAIVTTAAVAPPILEFNVWKAFLPVLKWEEETERVK